MISPHLLKVIDSFSTSRVAKADPKPAREMAELLWGADNGLDTPILFLESRAKKVPSWCHMILASGPGLSEFAEKSELIIVWWSEFEPDTSRVLTAIDWEKNAKDVANENEIEVKVEY